MTFLALLAVVYRMWWSNEPGSWASRMPRDTFVHI